MFTIKRPPFIIAALAGLTAALLTALPVRAQPLAPGFGVPTPSGIVGDGFEQDLSLDNTTPGMEIVYTSAPVGTGSSSTIWRSLDGGQTFKYVPAQIPPFGKPLACVGGGDSELAVDSKGRLYFNDLWLGNFDVARSDDKGATWVPPTGNCTGVTADTVVDRQWYTTIGDPVGGAPRDGLFLVYDRFLQSVTSCPGSMAVGNNALVIARSPAAGGPGPTAGGAFGPSLVLSCDEGIMGNDVSFTYPCTQGTGCMAGALPEVFVIHDNAAFNNITVNRCIVSAENSPPGNVQGLTCTPDILVASFPGAVTGSAFPTISVDNQGHLFAVWEESPGGLGAVTGNTQLFFSTSIDQGTTWSTAQHLPTPGLNQDVMAWPGSGDPGMIDVAFYGTPAPWVAGDNNGADSVQGQYGLYVVQTLDNGATWSDPVLASEHFIHYGSMYTIPGGHTGSRGLGDFIQLRIGPKGEAEVSYADTNLFEGNADLSPQAMYVRQTTGPSVYANVGSINGAAPPGSCVSDPHGDATFDANGVVGANVPHLDIWQACMTQPDANNYQITMQVADLTTPLGSSGPGPDPTAGGTVNLWQMQWHVPSNTDTTNGGALFMAYMESVNGAAPVCWVGQSSQQVAPGGSELTYPGTTQLPAADCQYTATAPGTITITVPIADVTEPGAINNGLYSVAASSQTVGPPNAENPPATNSMALGVVAGQLPNLIDVAPAFDFNVPSANIPEVPWTPIVVAAGAGVAAAVAGVRRQRRNRLMV